MHLLNDNVYFPDPESITLEIFGTSVFVRSELVWKILNITAIEVLVLLAVCVALCIWRKMPFPIWLAAAGFLVMALAVGLMDAHIFVCLALKISLYLWVAGTVVAVWKKYCEDKKRVPVQKKMHSEE